MKVTLDKLKQQYDKVKLIHSNKPSNKNNGCTVAVLWDGENRYVGVSQCSKKDQFSRKKGRQIALGRAKHVADTLSGTVLEGKFDEFLYKFKIDSKLPRDLKWLPKSLYMPKDETQ